MANLIHVIGIGPGNPDYITPLALELINKADILVGGERVLKPFTGLGKELFIIKNNLPEMVRFIKSRCEDCHVAVVASGDPGFYGILEYLRRYFAQPELAVLPGLSSIQLACARLCISWHDAVFCSIHGRDAAGLVELVRVNPKVIIMTDPNMTPAALARELAEAGVSNKKMYVCENLSYDNETIGEFDIDNVPEDIGKSGCVIVIITVDS
ncbi:MAG: precorrin-6y C5,15-methyltransferase (decarboxylating) subunit CbiE [Eubacteriales bacterium]